MLVVNDDPDTAIAEANGASGVTVALDRPDAKAVVTKLRTAVAVPVIAIGDGEGLWEEITSANIGADAYCPRSRLDTFTAALASSATRELHRDFIVGHSEAMRRLLALVSKVAPTPMSVLIEGESGSGKDVLARIVHAASPRHAAPFVAVNCAAIPATLLESELFGHVRGAFTDAKTSRTGFFEAADGGTLFLDEIGELPIAFQAKLLRACESGEIRPVGSSESKRVNVRILAATNRTLAAEVEAGRFRQDLFFRIHQFGLRVPSLAERREDLPALIDHFMADKLTGVNPSVREIDRSVMRMLEQYRFPGNVRELRSLLQSLKVIAEPPRIHLADLPRYIRAGLTHELTETAQVPEKSNEIVLRVDLGVGLKGVMTEVMAKVLRAYLALAGGVIKDAAILARVPLPTWYRKVREADLTREFPSEE